MYQYDDGGNPILIKNYDVVCREENYWRWIPVALKWAVNSSLLFDDKVWYNFIISISIQWYGTN